MFRPTGVNVVVFLVGVALLTAPLLSPPEAPPDRVEFYVEAEFGDVKSQPNLDYDRLPAAHREAFDAALEGGRYNASVAEAPPGLTPPPGGIRLYNVEYEGSYYLLQVKRLTYDVDPVEDLLPRFGAFAAGIASASVGAYREVSS